MNCAPGVGFREVESTDMALLHRWHNQPHVKEWYDRDLDLSTLESVAALYDGGGRKSRTRSYMILVEQEPVGYIQTYLIDDYPDYSRYLDVDENAAGVDLFIGEPDFVHRGLGAVILRRFLADVVFTQPGPASCIVGPEPRNRIAIRAYEKAGFRYLKTVQIPGEPETEALMRIAAEDFHDTRR